MCLDSTAVRSAQTENAFAAARRRAMHEAAGAPPQLTDGACAAAQSTGAAALRRILQARPLALRVHRERAIVDKSTDLWAADLHVGRALRKDNRGPRMLARTRTRRASCRPGGGRPSSPPERPCPGSALRGGAFPSVRSSPCKIRVSASSRGDDFFSPGLWYRWGGRQPPVRCGSCEDGRRVDKEKFKPIYCKFWVDVGGEWGGVSELVDSPDGPTRRAGEESLRRWDGPDAALPPAAVLVAQKRSFAAA